MSSTLKVRAARYGAALLSGVLTAAVIAAPALAVDCPGNPGALGTSRTLVVDPKEHPRIGTMQYAETLPLQDHEVVLTFDDGPLPPHSTKVLDILASQCVKATFFIIGRMARSFPEGVRQLRASGHSIGTHTQNHPLSMNRMPVERARQEIDEGIAATSAALGEAGGLAPFFRIPGLLRADAVENYLASQGIQIWSADFPADDWHHISAARVHEIAMRRLEAKGKGILLLHDIQGRTVAALPKILQDLKTRGYRVVHVVPATPDRPKTPTEPREWQLHPVSETVATSRWPKIPGFVFANSAMLPAPAAPDADWRVGKLSLTSVDRPARLSRGAVPLALQQPWPRPSPPQAANAMTALPVPDSSVFEIEEKASPVIRQAMISARHAEGLAVPLGNSTDEIGKLIAIHANASKRMIPGSRRIAQPGLRRVPDRARYPVSASPHSAPH
jgi:peptidoglycan/xylan/chitin deacetylase (PgdA/CDA1 family)